MLAVDEERQVALRDALRLPVGVSGRHGRLKGGRSHISGLIVRSLYGVVRGLSQGARRTGRVAARPRRLNPRLIEIVYIVFRS